METDCEIVWVKFDIVGTKSVYIAAYYLPNRKRKDSVNELEKSLTKICYKLNSHIWIGGDFNFPRYNWKRNCMKSWCSQPELTKRFIDLMANNFMTQAVSEPTCYQNTLDLFFTNNPTREYTKVMPGISADGHHTIYVECAITPIRNKHVLREIKLYSKIDWEVQKIRCHLLKTHSWVCI